MTARYRTHLHTRLEALRDNRGFDLIRPGPPARRTFEDLKPAYVTPSRSQKMLHSLFQSFAPNENAKLAETRPVVKPSKRWGARTAYAVSFKDEAARAMAMQVLDVIINAVGNSNDGETYAPLVHRTIRAADAVLVPQEGYGFSAVRRPLIFQVPTI
ncbi:MAG: hypothetical protein V7741_06770 [Hyphomonas sp.]